MRKGYAPDHSDREERTFGAFIAHLSRVLVFHAAGVPAQLAVDIAQLHQQVAVVALQQERDESERQTEPFSKPGL